MLRRHFFTIGELLCDRALSNCFAEPIYFLLCIVYTQNEAINKSLGRHHLLVRPMFDSNSATSRHKPREIEHH